MKMKMKMEITYDKEWKKWIELRNKFSEEVVTMEGYDKIVGTENVYVKCICKGDGGLDWYTAVLKYDEKSYIAEFDFYMNNDEDTNYDDGDDE